MATIIKVDGECIDVAPKNGKTYSFTEIIQLAGLKPGTFLQLVPLGKLKEHTTTDTGEVVREIENALLVCDEDGHRNRLSLNKTATNLLQDKVLGPVMGNVMVCHSNEID